MHEWQFHQVIMAAVMSTKLHYAELG